MHYIEWNWFAGNSWFIIQWKEQPIEYLTLRKRSETLINISNNGSVSQSLATESSVPRVQGPLVSRSNKPQEWRDRGAGLKSTGSEESVGAPGTFLYTCSPQDTVNHSFRPKYICTAKYSMENLIWISHTFLVFKNKKKPPSAKRATQTIMRPVKWLVRTEREKAFQWLFKKIFLFLYKGV